MKTWTVHIGDRVRMKDDPKSKGTIINIFYAGIVGVHYDGDDESSAYALSLNKLEPLPEDEDEPSQFPQNLCRHRCGHRRP